MTEAEQMVSGEACRSGGGGGKRDKNRNKLDSGRSYTGHRAVHNSECDASSELTSDGEADADVKSTSLNRTFNVPSGESSLLAIPQSDIISPVILRTRQKSKPQRPWSLSGLNGGPLRIRGVGARWTASETSLNHLQTSPTLSPNAARPLMCHASTQKDSAEVGGLLASTSLAGLSSSGSMGTSRLRRRRHSARFRNVKSLARRSGELPDAAAAQLLNSSEGGQNITLQALRLSASAASASSYSSGECSSSAGTGSQRSRRVVKSSTLTRLSVESCSSTNGVGAPTAVASPLVIAPIKAVASVSVPSVHNSSPRSAPSDGELCLAHVDETSNFSEQAWDNYLV